MKSCNPQANRQFLAGTMTDQQEMEFVAHLDACRRCQSRLEQSAGSDPDWREAREHLKLIPGVLETESPCSAAPTSEYELACLAPTDDPQMLGRIGPYEVSGVIGRGGMAVVFKAFDKALNRFVAIKVLAARLASLGIARQRFAREARAMAAVSHEHVVPVFAVEEHLGLPYLVMEYIPGTSLEHYLRRHGPLDVLAVIRVGLQVAQALAAAHAQGLVHRDIKPANILLDTSVERIKVGDFGLARVSHEADCTQSGAVAGTPQFMAPEQVRGETCSQSVDLFGLGALMYAMCSGTSPFRAETLFGVMQGVLEKTPKSLRGQNPDVPAWLEQFIFRLLEKNPEDRFVSADEVARLLERELVYLQHPTTAEKPDRSWAPRGRRSPRGRGFTLMARSWLPASLLAASLTAIGWLFWPAAGEDTPQDSADGGAHVSTEPPPAHWDTDGTSELAERVRQLGRQMHCTSEAPPTPDPWDQQVGEVRRRLSSLSESDPW